MDTKSLGTQISALLRDFPKAPPLPSCEDFERWTSFSTPELRAQVERVRDVIVRSPTDAATAASRFFLELMNWSLAQPFRPFGLNGATYLLERRVERILDSRDTQGTFTRLLEDQGLQDCLVLFARFIPIGIYHAELGAVPRSLLTQLAWKDAIRAAGYLVWEMHGLRPTVSLHMPKLRARRMTEEDYIGGHAEASGLFEDNPELRGFYSAAWYYDPAVAHISPHLSFFSRLATQHGSIRIRIAQDEDSVADSTWKSQTRRRLYEQGTYKPTRYARLWSRGSFLNWARQIQRRNPS